MPHPLSTSLRIKRLHTKAQLPSYATPGSAGMDLRACLPEGTALVAPNSTSVIPCGFSMQLDPGYEGQVRPRSGLSTRGITIPNSPGTIDADFRGEVKVILRNEGEHPFRIEHGDRIAQLVIAALPRVSVSEVEELTETVRGAGGLGSTGIG
jgi:dUTP pyrophosphatase